MSSRTEPPRPSCVSPPTNRRFSGCLVPIIASKMPRVCLTLALALLAPAGAAEGSDEEFVGLQVPSVDGFFYGETFQSGLGWTKSNAPDYADQVVAVEGEASAKAPFDEDHALVLVEDAKKYAVAGRFAKTLKASDDPTKPLVLQYEVR